MKIDIKTINTYEGEIPPIQVVERQCYEKRIAEQRQAAEAKLEKAIILPTDSCGNIVKVYDKKGNGLFLNVNKSIAASIKLSDGNDYQFPYGTFDSYKINTKTRWQLLQEGMSCCYDYNFQRPYNNPFSHFAVKGILEDSFRFIVGAVAEVGGFEDVISVDSFFCRNDRVGIRQDYKNIYYTKVSPFYPIPLA
jgi:hypothetical protein